MNRKSNTKGMYMVLEGATEDFFYKKMINELQKKSQNNIEVKWYNCKGDFKNLYKAKNHFEYHFSKGKTLFAAFLCFDTDITEERKNKQPFITMNDWEKLAVDLNNLNKIKDAYLIKQQSCIEDWLLKDYDNVIKHLGLLKSKKYALKNEQDLKKLYNLSKKAPYLHGNKRQSELLIDDLDVLKIAEKIGEPIKKILEIFGL